MTSRLIGKERTKRRSWGQAIRPPWQHKRAINWVAVQNQSYLRFALGKSTKRIRTAWNMLKLRNFHETACLRWIKRASSMCVVSQRCAELISTCINIETDVTGIRRKKVEALTNYYVVELRRCVILTTKLDGLSKNEALAFYQNKGSR